MYVALYRDEEGEGVRREGVEGAPALGEEGRMEEEAGEGEIPRINVEIPRCVANLGTDQYFVKLPNFLSVETRSASPPLPLSLPFPATHPPSPLLPPNLSH